MPSDREMEALWRAGSSGQEMGDIPSVSEGSPSLQNILPPRELFAGIGPDSTRPRDGNAPSVDRDEFDQVREQVDQLSGALGDRQRERRSELMLETVLAQGVGTNARMLAERRRRTPAAGIAGALLLGVMGGAALTYAFMKDKLEDAIETSCPANLPYTPQTNNTIAPATPTTSPSSRNALASTGDIQTNGEAAGLQTIGEAFAVTEQSDGTYVESSSTVFAWRTLNVSSDHTQYQIQLTQKAGAIGNVPDASLQELFTNGEYSQEEIGLFLVSNGVIDSTVSQAYVELVGSDGERLKEFIL